MSPTLPCGVKLEAGAHEIDIGPCGTRGTDARVQPSKVRFRGTHMFLAIFFSAYFQVRLICSLCTRGYATGLCEWLQLLYQFICIQGVVIIKLLGLCDLAIMSHPGLCLNNLQIERSSPIRGRFRYS